MENVNACAHTPLRNHAVDTSDPPHLTSPHPSYCEALGKEAVIGMMLFIPFVVANAVLPVGAAIAAAACCVGGFLFGAGCGFAPLFKGYLGAAFEVAIEGVLEWTNLTNVLAFGESCNSHGTWGASNVSCKWGYRGLGVACCKCGGTPCCGGGGNYYTAPGGASSQGSYGTSQRYDGAAPAAVAVTLEEARTPPASAPPTTDGKQPTAFTGMLRHAVGSVSTSDVWDSAFTASLRHGRELIQAGTVQAPVPGASLTMAQERMWQTGLMSVSILRSLMRSIDRGSQGIVLINSIEVTEANRPHNYIGNLMWRPAMQAKVQSEPKTAHVCVGCAKITVALCCVCSQCWRRLLPLVERWCTWSTTACSWAMMSESCGPFVLPLRLFLTPVPGQPVATNCEHSIRGCAALVQDAICVSHYH